MEKTKAKRIIEEYERVKQVHPSYAEIAKIVGTYKSYAYKVVQKYLQEKRATGGKI